MWTFILPDHGYLPLNGRSCFVFVFLFSIVGACWLVLSVLQEVLVLLLLPHTSPEQFFSFVLLRLCCFFGHVQVVRGRRREKTVSLVLSARWEFRWLRQILTGGMGLLSISCCCGLTPGGHTSPFVLVPLFPLGLIVSQKPLLLPALCPLLSSPVLHREDTKVHSYCEWLLIFSPVPSCLASLSLSLSDERSGSRSLMLQLQPLCLFFIFFIHAMPFSHRL